MPQYLIPQKTQREDKIIGPLTGKQLLYAMITIVGNFTLFSSVNSNPFIEFAPVERVLIVLPTLLLGVAFTMLQINERPFEIWFASFLTYLKTPKVRIWQKEFQPLESSAVPTTVKVATDDASDLSIDVVTRQKIEQLSQMVDKPDTMIPDAAPASSAPTSRTLELLHTLASSPGQEKSPNMQIMAKPRKGISGILHTISAGPQKMIASLFQDARTIKKVPGKKSKPSVREPDIPMSTMSGDNTTGQSATAPLDINALLSHHDTQPNTPGAPPAPPITKQSP